MGQDTRSWRFPLLILRADAGDISDPILANGYEQEELKVETGASEQERYHTMDTLDVVGKLNSQFSRH